MATEQHYEGRHFIPLKHLILISSQPVFARTPYSCLMEKQEIPIL
jgi:hypothetical protein